MIKYPVMREMAPTKVLFVLKIFIMFASALKEDNIKLKGCPLSCTCAGYAVNCSATNVFPENLPKDTQTFSLSNSLINLIPVNVFLNLQNLIEISIHSVRLTTIRACAFAELDNLVSIKFENVSVAVIEGNSFSNIVNITEIVFKDSEIDEIKSFAFHNIKSVSKIQFDNTNISVIHPYAILKLQNITELSVKGCTIKRFLRNGLSKLSDIEDVNMSNSIITVWHCGTMDAVKTSGADFKISTSLFVCDCYLAWLWDKHPNSTTILNSSNKCKSSDLALSSVNLQQICPSEKKRNDGCPQLLPSAPHTCIKGFDTEVDPVDKVAYPTYFSRNPNRNSVTSVHLQSPLIILTLLCRLLYRAHWI